MDSTGKAEWSGGIANYRFEVNSFQDILYNAARNAAFRFIAAVACPSAY